MNNSIEEDRGTWVHPGTPKSSKFICKLCGGEAYYPQANNNRKDRPICLRIPYNFCPHCGKKMLPVVRKEVMPN